MVIREAIDQLAEEEEWTERRRALEDILAAPPMEVPHDPRDVRREIEDARGRPPQ